MFIYSHGFRRRDIDALNIDGDLNYLEYRHFSVTSFEIFTELLQEKHLRVKYFQGFFIWWTSWIQTKLH